jgi:small multidrug resistance pump
MMRAAIFDSGLVPGGFLMAALVSLLGIGADSMLKAASQQPNVLGNWWFAGGLALTLGFALGWLVLMHHMKLATAGVIYAASSALLLAVIGVVFFEERLSITEIAGMGMALASVGLLSRFAA